jgi:spermidine synthase
MGLISLILLLMLLTGKREDSIMFLMGAGSSGFTLMVLLLLQIISGSLYLMTGLLLAVFMVGLASGSQLMSPNRWFSLSSRPWLLLAGFSMVTGSLALLASIVADNRAGSILKTMVMIVLFFLSAWIIGRLFQVLTSSTHTAGRAGKLYAADLMGSAIGAVLFPMVFLPLLGMVPTIAIISLFGIVSLALLLAKR